MKNTFLFFTPILFLLLINPLDLKAAVENEIVESDEIVDVQSSRVNVLLSRLDEIKGMEVSELSSSERKELRKEVRSIKGELQVMSEANKEKKGGGGIYISGGTVILILVLLIVLL